MSILCCKDCKYFNAATLAQCNAPGNKRIDYVTGGERFVWPYADTVRTDKTMCGPGGDWFEARESYQAVA